MTREPDPVRPEEWLLEAYFDEAPSPDTLSALKALAPSAGDVEPIVERLAEEDWVTLSQAGLEPIHAGRFFVHTPAHRDKRSEERRVGKECVHTGRTWWSPDA